MENILSNFLYIQNYYVLNIDYSSGSQSMYRENIFIIILTNKKLCNI